MREFLIQMNKGLPKINGRDVYGLSQSFKDRADCGAFWEAWVGASLSRLGLYVVHHPFRLASEEGKHTKDYQFSWDLDVAVDWPDAPATYWARLPVEVKAQNRGFTSSKDYPAHHSHPGKMLVCSMASWSRKWPGKSHTCRDFVFCSMQTGACLWLPQGSPVEMGLETFDSKRKELYRCVGTNPLLLRPLSEFVDDVKVRLG